MSIHPSAVIHPSAEIHPSVEIHANVIVEENVRVGEGCVLMPGVVLCKNTVLGKNNRLHYYAVIGGDPQYVGFKSELKTGVIMGDNCEIREYATVNRSIYEGKNTVLGSNIMMMINSHFAHDCEIADGVIIANNSLLAGHCTVGRKAFISGNVAAHQFSRIGEFAMVGGNTGIDKDIPPYVMTQSGGGLAFLVTLNVIGLRRGGIDASARAILKQTFKLLFKQTNNKAQGIANAEAYFNSLDVIPEQARTLVEFCKVKSRRGIAPGRRQAGVMNDAPTDDDSGAGEA
ncbi:MAG: acyl-ACP--UDP-N-acetylglucosamine O-acyltransferase [Sumerlaeia bacterium]